MLREQKELIVEPAQNAKDRLIMLHSKRYFKALFIVCLIALISIVGVVTKPQVAQAKEWAEMSTNEKATTTMFYRALLTCSGKKTMNDSSNNFWGIFTSETALNDQINFDHQNTFQWWASLPAGEGPAIFYFFQHTPSKYAESLTNDTVNCSNVSLNTKEASEWIEPAVKTFGFKSGHDALCAFGLKPDDNTECGPSESPLKDPGGTKYIPTSGVKDAIESNGFDRDSVYNLDGAKSYVLYRNVLFSACIGSEESRIAADDAPKDDKYYSIMLVNDGSQEAVQTNYVGLEKKDKEFKIYPDWSASDGYYNVKMTCGDIEKHLQTGNNNDITDYIAAIKDDVSKGILYQDTTDKNDCAVDDVGWIVCPVVKFLSDIADKAYGFIAKNFLVLEPSLLGSDTKAVWSKILGIANIAFIITFLIIIFSQITSVGITNYGIKKMLPKLIIAIILVNLSFTICQIMVDLSNIVGHYMASFIDSVSPMNTNIGSGVLPTSSTGSAEGLSGVAKVVLGSAGILLLAAMGVLIPVVLGAIVAAAMILFILAGRKALVVILVILSPLAFVAYLLPNTEKLFEQWKKAFTSMLLLYPIIALVFAGSKLASQILLMASHADYSDNTDIGKINQIIGAGVAVIPLFIVPGLLKKSLDGIAGIGNAVNKISSGVTGLGNKVSGGINKGVNTFAKNKFANTSFARGRALKKEATKRFKNAEYTKKLGKGGLASLLATSASLNGNKRRYINKQAERIQVSEKLKNDKEALDSTESIYQDQISSGKMTAEQLFEKASKENDIVGIKAATNILFKQGGGGRAAIHAQIKELEKDPIKNAEKIRALRTHIATTQPDLDTKDAAIAAWSTSTDKYNANGTIASRAQSLGDRKVRDSSGAVVIEEGTENSENTYDVNNEKMGGQSVSGLAHAHSKGKLTPKIAEEIKNNDSIYKSKMNQTEKDYIDAIIDGRVTAGNSFEYQKLDGSGAYTVTDFPTATTTTPPVAPPLPPPGGTGP